MKTWLFFTFLFSCSSFYASCRYAEVRSIHEVAGDILYDEENFWLILDLDDTLLQGGEALSHSIWKSKAIQGLQKQGIPEQEAWEAVVPFWLEIQEMGTVQPIESAIFLLIEKIQKQGKTTFVYTERPKTAKDLTLKQLHMLNVSLEDTAPQPQAPLPKNLLYTSGILFSGDYHKGPGLDLFLEICTPLPAKIIYIDNQKENVLRIGDLCQKYGIAYFGITYKAQELQPPIYFDNIAQVQYNYSKKLLSNEAAALLLRHQMHE
ncbi:conserved hypothetical protein [Chlamydia pneumoniae LPCoLN]|uniref:DUF2608 domain-containing protein n=1 Tax=Chlamydia pneumoniae TaxID=83558 RepID=UPI0001BD9EB3|nr:DUF2608 domain-containing protein [Chlamydia pneumoniae]ACZ32936.1 conserved hypothetical protein [Chlamydia pneumoniae LPCoLN]